MSNRRVPSEIWFTTTKTGKRRAWYYDVRQMRSFPYPLADAELAIATGAARETSKPMFVGGRR